MESNLVIPPQETAFPEGQTPTEEAINTYYEYDVDLIKTVLHNFSFAGLANKHPRFVDASCLYYDEITVHRSESEILTISTDPREQTLMISVCDPRCKDPYHEMTVILLSRCEAHILRLLLNKLKW